MFFVNEGFLQVALKDSKCQEMSSLRLRETNENQNILELSRLLRLARPLLRRVYVWWQSVLSDQTLCETLTRPWARLSGW
jgi:hypothetical protein